MRISDWSSDVCSADLGPVSVRIDSAGGDVFGGRAISQAIREYSGEVTCHIDGLAASSASYIAIAGDRVVAAPGAFLMIHRAWTFALGNCNDLVAQAGVLEKIDGTIAASYAAKAGEGDTDWLDLMEKESWFTAEESLALGLIDEVLPEQSSKAANVARASWNLTAYEHPPASEVEVEAEAETLPERSEEHTSELQSLMRSSYAVFCL